MVSTNLKALYFLNRILLQHFRQRMNEYINEDVLKCVTYFAIGQIYLRNINLKPINKKYSQAIILVDYQYCIFTTE